MSHTPHNTGPALDQEPMVIKDRDPGDENELPEEIVSQLTIPFGPGVLTFRQYSAIQHVTSVALLAFHPEVWLNNPEDEAQRMALFQLLVTVADRAMQALTSEEALDLKQRFAAIAETIFTELGVDVKMIEEKLKERFAAQGLEIARDDGTASLDG